MTDAPATRRSARSARGIASEIERRIVTGDAAPGERLPTVRGLARSLGVSPATVASAYRTLGTRGLVWARGRHGTVVRARPAVSSPLPPAVDGGRDLATGNPDPGLLPDLGPVLRRMYPGTRLYDEPSLDPDLLDLARRRLNREGVATPALTAVSGALDGIERVLSAHLSPGDRVAVEDPAFAEVLHLLAAMGLVPEPVTVDDSGPLPDRLGQALGKGARALVVTPRAQNPFGAAVDEPRRDELRSILSAHPDVLVVEDDHAGAVAGGPLRTLTGEDRPNWAFVHSVSKSLGPDLRLAVVSGDPLTVARVEGRRLLGPGWVSHLLQRAVFLLWSDPGLPALLRRAARTYAGRRDALRSALLEHGIESHGRSGLNVWIPVREEGQVAELLRQAGWRVRVGEPFRIASPPAIRVTVARLDAQGSFAFAKQLAQILSRTRTSRPA